MALVLHHFELTVAFADNSGDTVTRTYYVPLGVVEDFTEFVALIPDMITKIKAVTSALVTGYRANEVFYEDTVTLPASGVENENQALFSGKIVGDPGKSGTVSVPAANPAIFVATSGPGAKTVNMSNTDVLNFIQLFDGAPGWAISDGEYWLPATVKGKRRHTKNSSG